MIRKFIVSSVAIGVLLAMPGASCAEPLTEEQAVATAMSANPGIAAMQSHAEAMATIPAQAGALPDPELSIAALNLPTDSFSTTSENMTQMQLGVSQRFPFPGKRDLSRQSAAFEADSAGSERDEVRLRIERDVRSAWWELLYLDRSLAAVERNKALLRQLVKIAETRYRTGQGIQSDLLLAQLELSKLLDTEIALKAQRQGGQSRLNALLGREAGTAIELPAGLNESLPELRDPERLGSLARKQSPLLAAQRSRVDAARSRTELANRDYYPDFTLSGAYGWRNGINPATGRNRADMASIKLGITIPLYAGDKQSQAVQQRKAEEVRESYALNDLSHSIESEIVAAVADYNASRRQSLLFRSGIIPQASQTVASMLASYQVGKVDFLNLVRAQMTLYNYETEYWKAISHGHQALARLEAVVGSTITGRLNNE